MNIFYKLNFSDHLSNSCQTAQVTIMIKSATWSVTNLTGKLIYGMKRNTTEWNRQ